jgi:hypothetical protein
VPAWDNVFYDSPGLGYVTATHQQLRRHVGATVFTYYRALHDVMPAEGRRLLLETPRQAWAEGILAELERVHPDIRQRVTRLDVFRNGHAMRRPVPGSLFDGQRERLAAFRSPRITLAHADCRVSRCSRKRSIAACWRRSAAWGSADAPQPAASRPCSGRLTRKVVPTPTSLLTSMRPPCFLMMS